jgi:hypothetical protein
MPKSNYTGVIRVTAKLSIFSTSLLNEFEEVNIYRIVEFRSTLNLDKLIQIHS